MWEEKVGCEESPGGVGGVGEPGTFLPPYPANTRITRLGISVFSIIETPKACAADRAEPEDVGDGMEDRRDGERKYTLARALSRQLHHHHQHPSSFLGFVESMP